MADEKTQKPGLGRRKSSLDTLRHLSQRFKHVGRKTSESVEEEREIIGDVRFSMPPHLKMPDFAPFDSTSAADTVSHPSALDFESGLTSPRTAQPPLSTNTRDSAQESLLSPKPSTNDMSTTTTLLESSPILSDSTPWVGGTGLGNANLGKSGRVIEKLMAENDKLKREIKAEAAKREELQRTANAQKPRLEALQAENARLSHCKAVDESVIKRRDRKIEDLKAELDVERQKRESLENRALEAERKMGEYQEHSNKEVQLAIEEAKHATTHASILETSHRQLSSEYRQRIAAASKQLRELNDDREEDRKRLIKLDVVNHQMRQESEKARKLYNELLASSERYRQAKDSEVESVVGDVKELKAGINHREVVLESTLEEMHEVLNRMKWTMNMHKVNSENGVTSPPPSPPS
ncbi:hypothetical protein E4T52_13740 [Aureobasidium sp. EXF-3400]|nr:hypothetical protein E4T51_11912 [Aureobasidium sp. EXF-12344]KAI4771258.1 hypothetical protein E4T52_13740 [Aureobasidium sp. EXF-3400]